MGREKSRTVRYRPTALADLRVMWATGAEQWSPDQADRYLIDMTDAIERLAGNPAIVRERLEFSPPVRIYAFKAHVVVFLDEGDHLDIIRIRHGREDWASDPTRTG